MRLVVLANPRSGRGIARRLAADLRSIARERGHQCKVLEVGGVEALDVRKLGRADALGVIGGDGTVNRCARAAIESGSPMYQLPTGNENLFARAMGMRRSPRAMVAAMEAGQTRLADVGFANEHPFLLMASLGPDASVIHRVARARRRAIGHLAYVEPILRESCSPAIPTITVTIDGRPLIETERGVLIVSNTREYASKIDPCPDANLFSGQLHATFLPAEGLIDVLRWGIRARLRRLSSSRLVRTAVGRTVEISPNSQNAFMQHDGEAFGHGPRTDTIQLGIVPARLPVLLTATTDLPDSRPD